MSRPAATVCVTGASGFIASSVVNALLERGYRVRGTVRSLANQQKVNHLRALPGAAERLELVEADLVKDGSFDAAVAGCDFVQHVASPFFTEKATEPEAQLLRPAVDGTLNVLRACSKAGTVKRVVLTSSMAAVSVNGDTLPKDHTFSEEDWSREDIMRERGIWYPLSKTLAEKAAWDYVAAHKDDFDLVVINPCLVAGPMLQPSLNASSAIILDYLRGNREEIPNSAMGFVDVRDVAENHVLAMEKPKAQGRHVCESCSAPWTETCEILRRLAPESKVPTRVAEGEPATPTKFTNQKARDLGVEFRSLETMLADTVASLRQHGYFKE